MPSVVPVWPSKLRFRRRTGSIAGAALLLVVGIALVVLQWYWPFSQGHVTQALEETFAGKMTVTSFRSTHFPHPGCVIEGVGFVRPSTPVNAPPLVSIRKLTIEAHYWDLLLRPGYVARITLEGFHIQVPAIGSTADAGRPPASGKPLFDGRVGEVVADGSLLEIARNDGKDPLKFEIHSLTLNSVSRNGPLTYKVAFRNALPPGEIRSAGKFGPWNSANPGQTAVSGKYTLQGANLGVFSGIAGTLSSEDGFEGVLGHLESHGTIDVPDFEVTRSGNRVHLASHFQAIVNGTNGDVFLQRVDTKFQKTAVTTTGTIEGREGVQGKVTSLDFYVVQGRIQDCLQVFVQSPRAPLSGTTSFRAYVTVVPQGRPFLKEVNLRGDFGIADARFAEPSTQSDVDSLSERASSKKLGKDSHNDDDPVDVVSDLFGHLDVKDGVATLSDVAFRIPNAKARMHGTYNLLNQQIDFHGTLRTDAKLSETTNGFKSVLLKPFDAVFKRKRHPGAAVPVKLTGTYSDPHAGLDLLP